MSFSYLRTLTVLGAIVTTIVVLTAAQNGRARQLPILRPGSPDLDVSHLRERSDSAVFFRPTPGDTAKKIRMVTYQEEHLIDDPHGPAVLLINRSPGYADSAVVLRSSLRPISEIQNYFTRHRRLVYDYEGNRVRVRDSTADSVPRVREHTYDGDVFHFNELSLVIRSLPLRAGYEAILPLYSQGSDTLEMDTVRVVGKDDHGAWTVRFADPVIVVTHTVDGDTRRIISSKGGRRS